MPAPNRPGVHRRPASTPDAWLKPGLFLGALAPLASIALRALTGSLNANPVAQVENELGLAALIFLIASLACTPVRRISGWTWPPRIRRDLGLVAFAYAMLHVSVYVFLDQALDVQAIFEDVVKRPFITAGFGAAVLLIPLAITSTKSSIRRLGFVRWQRLHQLAYAAGVLAAIHFIWRVKIDVSQPLTYAAVLTILLLVRVLFWIASRRAASSTTGRHKRRIVTV
jgi:sulfoxide reductase heme-binding subunit YedZ